MNYFDDTMPSLTLLSDQSGPQIGGDLIRLQITNFPQVYSRGQVSVSFIFQGALGYIQDFEIVSSDSETTELLLVTPEFSGLDSDQSISISVEPASDPRKTVSFFYLIEMVQPEIVFYSPSAGLATGGSSILVDIKYFPHPTQVLVKFNELILPGEDVEILSSSDKTRTKVRLTTPDSDPGLYEVTIVPKTCSEFCAQAVHFQFEQVDASVPRLVQPIPTESSFQKAFLPLIYLENLPVDLDGATISAKFVGTDVSADVPLGLSDFYESAMAGVMAVSISIPATIAKQGSFFVTVTFALSREKSASPLMRACGSAVTCEQMLAASSWVQLASTPSSAPRSSMLYTVPSGPGRYCASQRAQDKSPRGDGRAGTPAKLSILDSASSGVLPPAWDLSALKAACRP